MTVFRFDELTWPEKAGHVGKTHEQYRCRREREENT